MTDTKSRPPVSVIILTHNEEINIARCLKSLAWCEDIHIVDSGSSDRTCEIVSEFGVRLYEHPFRSFGDQRNWALDNCDVKNDWILFLDADECSYPAFEEDLKRSISECGEDVAGFYCCWKTMLDDQWLKRSDSYPRWQFRLLRRGKACFEDFGHSQREKIISGELSYLRTPYLHYPFSKGWDDWWARHDRYAAREAESRSTYRGNWRELFHKHPAQRIKYLKSFVSKVPGWPLIHFFIRYVMKLGFLDGRSGFIFCRNMSYYEYMIQSKMRALR